MTTLAQRPHQALIVIDVQNEVVAGTHQRDAVVANIGAAVARARAAGVPVIWVQDQSETRVPGSESFAIVPELEPAATEPRVVKEWGDSFEATDLEDVLANLGVGHLYVTGAQTDQCIRSTLHGGLVRGYDMTLVSDAHTTSDNSEWGAPPPGDVIAHTNLYWTYHSAPGRTAGTVATADLDFAAAPAQ